MIGMRAGWFTGAMAAGWCVAACVLGGCGQGEKAGKPAPAGKPRVALVMKSLANEFFKTMEDGARAHQKAHAGEYGLIANGIKDEQDVAGQTAIVEQMIAQQVNALVIAPADSKALVPVCKKAIDAGIVVVNIDNKFDEAVLAEKKVQIPFVGPDNRKGAQLAGMYVGKRLMPRDKVAFVEGRPNAYNAIQRKQGFNDAMWSCKTTVASSQSGLWETEQAMKIVGGMITQYPDIRAVLCANDSMALGAVAALKSAGKLDKVMVVGYDNISAVQQLIKEGKILCTVDQHGDKIAVYGIEYALEILKTHAAPKDKETPVDLVTAETLK